MNAYSGWERRLARLLESAPGVRKLGRWAYHRVNYLIFREAGFRVAVHARARLLALSDWLGSPVEDGEIFFGYYDKAPWTPDMQEVLYHRPDGRGGVEIVSFARDGGDKVVWGRSTAWNHQQGSMAQWVPWAEQRSVVFNDYVGGELGARIVERGGKESFFPYPVQALNPRVPEALSLNYHRLARLRPEYGYRGRASNFDGDQPMEEDGLWRVDFTTGDAGLIISLAELRRIAPRPEMDRSEHKVNHAVYSPEGTRFVFMHRWLGPAGKFSRLYVAASDGSALELLLDHRMVSHYNWLDEDNLIAWARTAHGGDRYYIINVPTGRTQILARDQLDIWGDGHPSISPNRRWLVTDSYPDRSRQRRLVLFDLESGCPIELGRFLAPWKFNELERCDLHPRWSPDGTVISIDSAHEGLRKTYFVDVSRIVSTDNGG